MINLIRVLIVDDHPLMRKGIKQLLLTNSNFQVVGEAKNGIEAVSYSKKLQPDLVLLDFNMPGISGLETLKAIRKQNSETKVIIFTVSDNKQDVIAMINQGASGYLLKDSEPDTLLKNITEALSGELIVSPKLFPYLQELDQEDNIRDKLSTLTKREKQTLHEISQSYSNKEIAVNLNISEGTVKVHVKSLLKKLQMKSRIEAAVLYLQLPK